MYRIRTSIAGLMAAVFFVAIAIAALLNASPLWASCLFMLTVTLMSAAIVGAIAGRSKARMTWTGAAVFGWVYLGIVFGPVSNGNETTIPALPAMVVYDFILKERVIPKSRSTSSQQTFFNLRDAGTLSAYNTIVSMNMTRAESLIDGASKNDTQRLLRVMMDLRRIVHSLGSIAFAALGGLVGQLFYSRRLVQSG